LPPLDDRFAFQVAFAAAPGGRTRRTTLIACRVPACERL